MSTSDLVATWSQALGFSVADIIGPSRCRKFVRVRREIAKRFRLMGLSFPEIGEAIGGRHHTTIMNLVLPKNLRDVKGNA